jgi:hypothetical protein
MIELLSKPSSEHGLRMGGRFYPLVEYNIKVFYGGHEVKWLQYLDADTGWFVQLLTNTEGRPFLAMYDGEPLARSVGRFEFPELLTVSVDAV